MKFIKLHLLLMLLLAFSSNIVPIDKELSKGGIWPVRSYIEIDFGAFYKNKITNKEENSKGLYLSAKNNSQVKAFRSGTIKDVVNHKEQGFEVTISHSNDMVSQYSYLGEIKVKKNEKVNMGQVIGLTLNSKTESARIYFELRLKGEPVDPKLYILFTKSNSN